MIGVATRFTITFEVAVNPKSIEFEKSLAEEMYDAYHERVFGVVPTPFRDRHQHVRDAWQHIAGMAVGFVVAADVKPEHPQPSVN